MNLCDFQQVADIHRIGKEWNAEIEQPDKDWNTVWEHCVVTFCSRNVNGRLERSTLI